MRRKPGTLLLIAAAAVALAACAEEDQPTIVPDPEETAPAPAPEEDVDEAPTEESATPAGATIGDVVRVGDLQITVHGVRRAQSGLVDPEPGTVYLLVEATIENLAAAETTISSLLQMDVRDSEGRVYDITIGAETAGSLDGTVLARDKVRGEVAFAVPASATGFRFVFDPIFGGAPVVIALE